MNGENNLRRETRVSMNAASETRIDLEEKKNTRILKHSGIFRR